MLKFKLNRIYPKDYKVFQIVLKKHIYQHLALTILKIILIQASELSMINLVAD